MAPDWTDGYYGDLYRGSVGDLLSPELSAVEAEIIARLLRLGPGHRLLDLACGWGRHAWPLADRARLVVGLERSPAYLAAAREGGPTGGGAGRPAWLRADLRALPLAAGSFDALASWYASLFMWDDARNEAALAEAARVVRRGGRLLIHHANPLSLAARPEERARRELPGGGVVEEESRFDAATGVDRCRRRWTRPGAPALEGTAELRYYTPSEWEPLAARAGLRLEAVTSSAPQLLRRHPEEAPDLIALLEKP